METASGWEWGRGTRQDNPTAERNRCPVAPNHLPKEAAHGLEKTHRPRRGTDGGFDIRPNHRSDHTGYCAYRPRTPLYGILRGTGGDRRL